MARPLRLEFANALYHITSRGDGRELIYLSDDDRHAFLELFGEVCKRFTWRCHAYCLMGNYYHLVVETREGNLAKGMRQLNGVYTQDFNRRHRRVGHVFQGRYKAILVDKQSYLLELARYVVLNPVRARLVSHPEAWPWSSYGAMLCAEVAQEWLETDWLLGQFAHERAAAIRAYERFVAEADPALNLWSALVDQIYLGSEAFVAQMKARIEARADLSEVPRPQRRQRRPLAYYRQMYPSADEAMARAYLGGHYTLREIASHFGVHYTTVSRALKAYETQQNPSAG